MPASHIVDAEPTKDFFISMLTKDIELIDAIADLVDNSVDGARRLRGGGPYDGLWIRIEIGRDTFRISDNCGGIPLDVARDYAFRFGRAPGMSATPHAVGQFGVGMKRAIFKLGRHFTVSSVTQVSRFTMTVDVDAWKLERGWQFVIDELQEDVPQSENHVGTTLEISKLNAAVRDDFALDEFAQRLRKDLSRKHEAGLNNELALSTNGIPLRINIAELLASDQIQPAHRRLSFGEGPSKVDVRIYAGLAASRPQDAGWYVYCNGRLVLGPDQSSDTAWGWGADGVSVPRYHGQFAAFRGYVFFDSDDASRLPWNTTKTGVDLDSDIYRSVRREMLLVMRPVIDFLNRLDAEGGPRKDEAGPLAEAVKGATQVHLAKIPEAAVFVAPQAAPRARPPETSSIQYVRAIAQISRLKKALGVGTNREVGERTFDLVYGAEVADDANG